jgi:hypothetical protein
MLRGVPENRTSSVDIDASRDLQRHDQRDRVWKHGRVKLSGHVEHGQAIGFGIILHIGRCRAVPTGSDGTAAATRNQSVRNRPRPDGRRMKRMPRLHCEHQSGNRR